MPEDLLKPDEPEWPPPTMMSGYGTVTYHELQLAPIDVLNNHDKKVRNWLHKLSLKELTRAAITASNHARFGEYLANMDSTNQVFGMAGHTVDDLCTFDVWLKKLALGERRAQTVPGLRALAKSPPSTPEPAGGSVASPSPAPATHGSELATGTSAPRKPALRSSPAPATEPATRKPALRSSATPPYKPVEEPAAAPATRKPALRSSATPKPVEEPAAAPATRKPALRSSATPKPVEEPAAAPATRKPALRKPSSPTPVQPEGAMEELTEEQKQVYNGFWNQFRKPTSPASSSASPEPPAPAPSEAGSASSCRKRLILDAASEGLIVFWVLGFPVQ